MYLLSSDFTRVLILFLLAWLLLCAFQLSILSEVRLLNFRLRLHNICTYLFIYVYIKTIYIIYIYVSCYVYTKQSVSFINNCTSKIHPKRNPPCCLFSSTQFLTALFSGNWKYGKKRWSWRDSFLLPRCFARQRQSYVSWAVCFVSWLQATNCFLRSWLLCGKLHKGAGDATPANGRLLSEQWKSQFCFFFWGGHGLTFIFACWNWGSFRF